MVTDYEKYFSTKLYEKLVENTNNESLRTYIEAENDFIKDIDYTNSRTFVDLGAGYGRVLPLLSKCSKNVIAVEINQNEFGELERRATSLHNATAIKGDIAQGLELPKLEKPVFLLLQNTLGTVQGDHRDVLDNVKKLAKKNSGDIVVSVFRQTALKSHGIRIYESIKEMVGEPDLEKTDFNKGIFRSKNGYTSKWWSEEEIKEMERSLGGSLIKEELGPSFFIFQIRYD